MACDLKDRKGLSLKTSLRWDSCQVLSQQRLDIDGHWHRKRVYVYVKSEMCAGRVSCLAGPSPASTVRSSPTLINSTRYTREAITRCLAACILYASRRCTDQRPFVNIESRLYEHHYNEYAPSSLVVGECAARLVLACCSCSVTQRCCCAPLWLTLDPDSTVPASTSQWQCTFIRRVRPLV
jgi:hypothetical protein